MLVVLDGLCIGFDIPSVFGADNFEGKTGNQEQTTRACRPQVFGRALRAVGPIRVDDHVERIPGERAYFVDRHFVHSHGEQQSAALGQLALLIEHCRRCGPVEGNRGPEDHHRNEHAKDFHCKFS